MMSTALIQGTLVAEPSLIEHLNHCLLCRACEKACPSEVPFGAILDTSLSHLSTTSWRSQLIEWMALHPKWLQKLAVVAAIWRSLRLPLPPLGRASIKLLPKKQTAIAHFYPALQDKIGRVGLFLGCFARPFDLQTHHAAIQILTQLGYEVMIPPQQQCCGALSQHHGNPQQAKQQAAINRSAFGNQPLDAILFTSTGCGVQLIEQSEPGTPCIEFCDFVLQSLTLKKLPLKPLAEEVMLHHPCSLSNVIQGSNAVEALLMTIPGFKHQTLAPGCCGAAGSHRIREPQTADTLRQPKIEALQQSGATTLITTNYGCALHFAEGVELTGLTIEIIHPATLLFRHLKEPPLDPDRLLDE
jgi:glycolate oxidase iron-sulfur subunit